MTITLDLPLHLETQLRERVGRGDADVVRRRLVEALTPTVEALLREAPAALTDAEFEAAADELADELITQAGSTLPWLSVEAVSREGIYEDHP